MSPDPVSLEGFRGMARLFPLPDLVLFPSVVQPLHIFEPRYRQMLADALDDDRLLALVLLRPGFEAEYHDRPPIHSIACLGRIFNEQRLGDGRFNLLLHGLRRIRIDHELPPDQPYRMARVELLDEEPMTSAADEARLRGEMRRQLPPLLQAHGGAIDQAEKLLESDMPLGMLCDVFSFALPLDPEWKQQLLEELHPGRRAASLLAGLGELVPPPQGEGRRFPPDFSSN